MVGLCTGASLGLFSVWSFSLIPQWLVLRSRALRAYWWVLASTSAWAIVYLVIRTLFWPLAAGINFPLGWLEGGAIRGALDGAVGGLMAGTNAMGLPSQVGCACRLVGVGEFDWRDRRVASYLVGWRNNKRGNRERVGSSLWRGNRWPRCRSNFRDSSISNLATPYR